MIFRMTSLLFEMLAHEMLGEAGVVRGYLARGGGHLGGLGPWPGGTSPRSWNNAARRVDVPCGFRPGVDSEDLPAFILLESDDC
jgi:hypothetical protein